MRSRNFLDAAQAEKMREREAMENVKLLYHDNMIEMTAVSVVWTLSCYALLNAIISFVTLHNVTIYCSYHIKTCNNSVIAVQIINISSIKYLVFSLVGKTVNDRWCEFIG